jgi:hypothetical protein
VRRLIAILIAMGVACSAPAATVQDLAIIEHVAPKRDATGGVPPKFEWTAIKGADLYVLSMWNDIDVLIFKQNVAATAVEWPKELTVEQGTYFWEVLAMRGDEPVGRSGRAAFVILDK